MPRHFENARPRRETGDTSQQKLNKLASQLHRQWVSNGNTQYMPQQATVAEIAQQNQPAELIPRQLAHVALAAER